jgi:hypothetical protein
VAWVRSANLIEPLLGLKYGGGFGFVSVAWELNRTTFGIEICRCSDGSDGSDELNRTTFGIEILKM